jgi:hypothetical protein
LDFKVLRIFTWWIFQLKPIQTFGWHVCSRTIGAFNELWQTVITAVKKAASEEQQSRLYEGAYEAEF